MAPVKHPAVERSISAKSWSIFPVIFEFTTPSLQAAEAITAERLGRFPESHIFQFADREIARIRSRIIGGGALNKAFYDSINIGLICARELEQNDIEYCDVIYSMLEDLRWYLSPSPTLTIAA